MVLLLVGDGQAALDCLAQRQFDLVLLDVSMPRLGGLQAQPFISELTRVLRL